MMESDRLSARKSTLEDHIRFDFSFLKIRNTFSFSLVCCTEKNGHTKMTSTIFQKKRVNFSFVGYQEVLLFF